MHNFSNYNRKYKTKLPLSTWDGEQNFMHYWSCSEIEAPKILAQLLFRQTFPYIYIPYIPLVARTFR